MGMKLLCYSTIRYVADVVQESSVNIGVIVISDTEHDGVCLILPEFSRSIRFIDPLANVETIRHLLTSLRRRIGANYQTNMFAWEDERIISSEQLKALAGALRNQLQLTAPVPYRAVSLRSASSELYRSMVRFGTKERLSSENMTLEQLNDRVPGGV